MLHVRLLAAFRGPEYYWSCHSIHVARKEEHSTCWRRGQFCYILGPLRRYQNVDIAICSIYVLDELSYGVSVGGVEVCHLEPGNCS